MTSPLRTRPLGSSGVPISEVGLGAWAIGGRGWGDQDDDVSIATIRRALDAGVTWIDTAPAYGLGRSEEVVGRAIAGRRDDVFVATKCIQRWTEDGDVYRDGSPASIKEECDESLRRLGIDHLDLLQIHAPDDNKKVPVEETWGALADLQDAGKTRFIGVSNFTVEMHRTCEAIRHVDSTQPPYNLIDPSIEEELLPYCQDAGTAVVPYGPMAQGMLTTTFDRSRLPAEDWRNDDALQWRIDRGAAIAERLRPLADRFEVTTGQLAIWWVLSHPVITSAIVGMRRPDQVDENVVPAAEPIPDDLRRLVADALADLPA